MKHGHGFGCGRRFVEQGGVGRFHARQVANHGLEVQQAFEPALRDFGLVRRIRRVPAWIFKHIAQNDAGRHAVAVAYSDIGPEQAVLGGDQRRSRRN